MNPHVYSLVWGRDGDYVIWESFDERTGVWTEHTRWLIPGTQLEG